MGEGNWKIARKDRPVQLIDRPLGIGGLDNPPTVLFQAQPGPATLVSLVPVLGEQYRLVVTQGTIPRYRRTAQCRDALFHDASAERRP